MSSLDICKKSVENVVTDTQLTSERADHPSRDRGHVKFKGDKKRVGVASPAPLILICRRHLYYIYLRGSREKATKYVISQ